METLTVEKAHELLKRAVVEKGEDYVHPAAICYYFDPETREPSCIVGHVLHYLGVDPDTAHEHTNPHDQPSLEGAAGGVLDALTAAQVHQDNRGTWGEALRAFEIEAGLVSA